MFNLPLLSNMYFTIICIIKIIVPVKIVINTPKNIFRISLLVINSIISFNNFPPITS